MLRNRMLRNRMLRDRILRDRMLRDRTLRGGPLHLAPIPRSLPIAPPLAIITAAAALHHNRRPVLQLVDADRQIADHILVDPHGPFELGHSSGGRREIQQHVVTFAVFPHAIHQVAQPPVLALLHLAAIVSDELSESVGERINLGAGNVLARDEHVLVQWHGGPYPLWLVRIRGAGADRIEPAEPARVESLYYMGGRHWRNTRTQRLLDNWRGAAITTRPASTGAGRLAKGGPRFRMKRAFVFPGQGSQAVGMGRVLATFAPARRVFDEVDDALSQNLSRLMFEGPEGELTLTENAQPALLAASLAVIRILEAEGGFALTRHSAFVAGHSLGEYSALAAAGTLTIGDGARLLRLRGQAMQEAVPVGEGAMAALLGLDVEQGQAVATEAAGPDQVCAVANDNSPGQVVVSGHRQAVERAIAIARANGARRSISLPVSAPFHSPLMAPAAEVMAKALCRITLQLPAVPLVANVSATATRDPARIKHGLIEQVTAMVRWRESMLFLKQDGVEEVVEIGTGRVLTGLAKRIDPDLSARSVGTPAEIASFIEEI